ncbi:MAG TPA: class I SAM-dependent methyltransferase [Rhizomicrobium sp.]|nr:class I SAM-dependent methyltransferase [Rhizomicrobium sp.]
MRTEASVDSRLAFPDEATLVANLVDLSRHADSIRRYLAALDAKHFVHPNGNSAPLDVALSPPQAALLAWLAQRCPVPLSVEAGFGMGTSASVILGARGATGKPFEHLIFDPFPKRGVLVQSYLEAEFGDRVRRCHERSETGLGRLLSERGQKCVGLAFIDGGHLFETVMTDFRLADLLCCDGGYIVFDDALLPAIETVINYVRCNRPDYALAHLAAPNTTVLKKIAPDAREWSSFVPFPVAQRENWTNPHAPARSRWFRRFGR